MSKQAASHPLDRRAVGLLTVGHGLIDLTQGAVAALIPLFVAKFNLSYAAAAALVLAATLASSIVQPLFGYYADRVSSRWLLPASILTALGGLMTAALAPTYGVALAAVAVSGLGVAAFHPEAARLVHFAGGERLTTAMSCFSVGGGLGFAVAPLLMLAIIGLAGMSGILVLVVPALLVAALFAISHSHHQSLVRRHDRPKAADERRPAAQWGAFMLLTVTIAVRSAVFFGFNAFLIVYWEQYLGQSRAMGSVALSLVLGSSVVGTLVGGYLSDRFGRRAVLRYGMLSAAALFGVFAATGDPTAALLLLVPIGVLFSTSSSPLFVMGQQFLPGRVGMASGITIGLAVSCGGVIAPALGWAADTQGIGIIPWLLTGFALASAMLAMGLPSPTQRAAVCVQGKAVKAA